ncbi:hypothetical protein [Porphyromonas cangingivalis]|uniref:hypothetical protein n=1 Tax=Porphyromonas cangingivalis TaxID=36874 RepID=UPI00051D8772|nr:hypothetical protein [Porphyromonas cangingivalis]KGL50242.1 hypothetical protein HQ34_00995 [Porphyromonas cangingivalis]
MSKELQIKSYRGVVGIIAMSIFLIILLFWKQLEFSAFKTALGFATLFLYVADQMFYRLQKVDYKFIRYIVVVLLMAFIFDTYTVRLIEFITDLF